MTHASYKERRASAQDCRPLECRDGRGIVGIEFEGTNSSNSDANDNGPTVVWGCT